MKKYFISIVVVLLFVSYGISVYGMDSTSEKTKEIKIMFDGKKRTYESPPIIQNDRTLLPLRFIVEDLGIPTDPEHLQWDSNLQRVTLSNGNTSIILNINDDHALVNGQPLVMDVAPIIVNDRTYVPVRFISQAFGKKVVWDGDNNCVLVTDQTMFDSVKNIIQKSNQKVDSIRRYYADMSINTVMTVPNYDLSYDLSLKTFTMMDRENNRAYTREESTYQDNTKSVLNTYHVGQNLFKQLDLGDWSRQDIKAEEAKRFYDGKLRIAQDENVDRLSAGLVLQQSTDQDILLSGDVYLSNLLNQSTDGGSMNICDASLEIAIDPDTFCPKSYRMSVKGDMIQNDQQLGYSADILLLYSKMDSEFTIPLPDPVEKLYNLLY